MATKPTQAEEAAARRQRWLDARASTIIPAPSAQVAFDILMAELADDPSTAGWLENAWHTKVVPALAAVPEALVAFPFTIGQDVYQVYCTQETRDAIGKAAGRPIGRL